MSSRRVGETSKRKFLEGLEQGMSVATAAKYAGHHRSTFNDYRNADPDFARAVQEAIDAGTEHLEDKLIRYAEEGWDEETFNGKGELVLNRRRRDPRMIAKVVDRRKPVEQRVELSGRDGGPIVAVGANVGLAEVARWYIENGKGHLIGISPADDSRSLPRAQDVLPDQAELAAASSPDVPRP